MAKRTHQEEQNSSSRAALIGMSVAGLAVAGLVVWALTRTVQPAPSVMSEVPMGVEQPTATNTVPAPGTAQNPVQITNAQPSTTAAPAPVPAQSDENASVKRMSVPELRSKIDGKQVTVIDVRDKTSFINSHIPGALHIPMAQVESQVTFLPKNKPIVTYCTWPNEESSARAALILERYGFTNVTALEGGYDAWRGAGAPMAEGDPPPIP